MYKYSLKFLSKINKYDIYIIIGINCYRFLDNTTEGFNVQVTDTDSTITIAVVEAALGAADGDWVVVITNTSTGAVITITKRKWW